jgi:hypothetical protein
MVQDVRIPPDYPRPPGYHSPPRRSKKKTRQQQALQPNQAVAEDMQMFEDDGVRLDENVPVASTATSFDISTVDDAAFHYYQPDLAQLQDTNSLWQLPVPVPVMMSPNDLKGLNKKSAQYIYFKSCHLIRKQWNCEVDQAIPDTLHRSTPYSLALLSQLRRLAGQTFNNLDRAQRLIIQAWTERLNSKGLPNDPSQLLVTESSCDIIEYPEKYCCEEKFQENEFGLKLVDVVNAVGTAKRANQAETQSKAGTKKLTRQQRKAALNARLQMEGAQAKPLTIGDRWMQKGQSIALNNLTAMQEPQNLLVAPSQTSNSAPSNLSSAASLPTFEVAIRPGSAFVTQATQGATQVLEDPADDGEEVVVYVPPKQRKRNDPKGVPRAMVNMAKRMQLDESDGLGRKKKKVLQSGGLSRRLHRETTSLPFEKVDLNSLPSLHSMSATSAEELAQLGQSALPD